MSRRFGFIALGLLIGLPGSARAETPPHVSEVTTHFSGRELRVHAHLEPGLPTEIKIRLSSGLATTTVWKIGLFVSRSLWPDGKKDERLYAVTATFRPASGDYSVERRLDGRLLDVQVFPNRDEAAGALATISSLPVFLMGGHLTGKPLVVKVRCVYAAGVSLGVVPTTGATSWRSSAVFEWTKGELP